MPSHAHQCTGRGNRRFPAPADARSWLLEPVRYRTAPRPVRYPPSKRPGRLATAAQSLGSVRRQQLEYGRPRSATRGAPIPLTPLGAPPPEARPPPSPLGPGTPRPLPP